LLWMQSIGRTLASDEDVDGYIHCIIHSCLRSISLGHSLVCI
jgi:hypothetical protein